MNIHDKVIAHNIQKTTAAAAYHPLPHRRYTLADAIIETSLVQGAEAPRYSHAKLWFWTGFMSAVALGAVVATTLLR